MPISDTGIWLNEDGEVVTSQPRGRATQLVAKGGEISGAARSRAESLGVSLPEDDAPEVPVVDETADAPAVETAVAAPKPARKARKG